MRGRIVLDFVDGPLWNYPLIFLLRIYAVVNNPVVSSIAVVGKAIVCR